MRLTANWNYIWCLIKHLVAIEFQWNLNVQLSYGMSALLALFWLQRKIDIPKLALNSEIPASLARLLPVSRLASLKLAQ